MGALKSSYNPILIKHGFENFKKLIDHVKGEERSPETIYKLLGGTLPKKKDAKKS